MSLLLLNTYVNSNWINYDGVQYEGYIAYGIYGVQLDKGICKLSTNIAAVSQYF